MGRLGAVLNLGGIANITVLDHDPRGSSASTPARRTRFSTGSPASCHEARSIVRPRRPDRQLGTGERATGRDAPEDDAYLAKTPPKSTGFEMYGDAFIDRAAELHGGV